jgi:hypothetical protein
VSVVPLPPIVPVELGLNKTHAVPVSRYKSKVSVEIKTLPTKEGAGLFAKVSAKKAGVAFWFNIAKLILGIDVIFLN